MNRDRGSADAFGIAVLGVAALAMALAISALGRRVDARATANNAAEAAAHAAALERTSYAATQRATAVVNSMVGRSASCASADVEVDTAAFRPGGVVEVTVRCRTSAAGLELAGATDSTTSATAIAAIDPYRSVQP